MVTYFVTVFCINSTTLVYGWLRTNSSNSLFSFEESLLSCISLIIFASFREYYQVLTIILFRMTSFIVYLTTKNQQSFYCLLCVYYYIYLPLDVNIVGVISAPTLTPIYRIPTDSQQLK